MFPVSNDNQNDNLTITISAQEGEDAPMKEGEDVPVKEDVPIKGKMWP